MRYRREVRGHGVDLRGLDAGLKCCVFRGGVREAPSPCLSFLNERGKAGGTQCVVVLWGHVLSISEDRASGTRMESGWCSGECRLCEAERTQDVWIADTRGDMRSCHEKIQGVCVHNDAFRCNNPQLQHTQVLYLEMAETQCVHRPAFVYSQIWINTASI